MADPNNLDDLTKVGAGGGVVAALALMGRMLSGAATSNRLEAMQTQLADLGAKMTVVIAALERRDGDFERLDAERRLLALEERQRAQERSLEEVRATVKELSEGLVR